MSGGAVHMKSDGPYEIVRVGETYEVRDTRNDQLEYRSRTLDQALSALGVRAKAERKRQTVMVRPCIRCRRDFESEGAHHRMCATCRLNARDIYHGAV